LAGGRRLRAVEIFSSLSDEQLDCLCAAMSQAPFEKDTYVFEQGDDGDVSLHLTA